MCVDRKEISYHSPITKLIRFSLSPSRRPAVFWEGVV